MAEQLTVGRFLRAVAASYAVIGFFYWFDRTSPLGWWTLKPKTTAEMDMAKFYRRDISKPLGEGNENAAVRRYLERGGGASTVLLPRFGEDRTADRDSKRALHEEMVEREAAKLWLRMRREAVNELRSQGYDV